jgi:hypothetical protein
MQETTQGKRNSLHKLDGVILRSGLLVRFDRESSASVTVSQVKKIQSTHVAVF